MTELTVYLPTDATASWPVDAGSGIVGTPDGEGSVLIDFEGNRYEFAELTTWPARVARAAERHAARYPTVARALVPEEWVVAVGSIDAATGEVTLDEAWREHVDRWVAA